MKQAKRNERLRAAYAARGHSQSAFAALCGVSQPAMSAFASYTSLPSLGTLRRMLDVLGVDVARPVLIGFLVIDGRVVDLPSARKIARLVLEVGT